MKKVLSVLLAAAMVMGMSVSAFADHSWLPAGGTDVAEPVANVLDFEALVVVEREDIGGWNVDYALVPANTELDHEPGDNLYFPLLDKTTGTNYVGSIDPQWSINIKGNVYVDGASYYTVPATGAAAWGETGVNGYKYVKVEIADDLDATTTKTVKFELYIADEDYKNCETEHVAVEADFANVKESINEVDFDHTNDTDEAAVWAVAKGAKGTATFDFDSAAYYTVKMVPEEKVTLNLSTAYDKAVDKLFDYEADLSFYNFKGTKDAFTKTGELFIPADEDTFIYEVVDGELVEIDAVWTDEYTITDVTKEYEGWVIETKELGYYVVSDIEAVIEAEEVEFEETETDATKANPETGAADFVGAAVALAVVSVAAAGALAL
ncbi:MAG: hypothetical protein IJ411_01155, partial [Oscillospiraceae bacterium]|nr:hypothetical protein [Oscillospiraceae bacterium]